MEQPVSITHKKTIDELIDIYKIKQRVSDQQPHAEIRIPCGHKYGGTREWEVAFLARAAHQLEYEFAADKVIVEIGSLLGKSAIALASATTRDIIAIDPHTGPWDTNFLHFKGEDDVEDGSIDKRGIVGDTYDRMVENIEYYGYTDRIQIICQYSDQAAKEWDGREICLLFIDGDHSYKWVRHDVVAFLPYLAANAVIIFHDYCKTFEGVNEAVEGLKDEGILQAVGQVGDMLMTRCINGTPLPGTEHGLHTFTVGI
jgi:predicted O-methyltransferase YrrM